MRTLRSLPRNVRLGQIKNIVAYLHKERTVEPEKQFLLANSSETTFDSRQRLGKHVPTATDRHATMEVLL
jgi:type IV secretory pathway protease TraF